MNEHPRVLPSQDHTRSRIKLRLIVILLCIGVIGSGFLWIRNMYRENQDAQSVLDAHTDVITELARCDTLLGQPQGEFDEYEYCKKFVTTFGRYR